MLALQLLCNGIVTGCALGIVAVSFSFIYATTKIFHVAHAGVYTMGGYIAWSMLRHGFATPIAFLTAVAACTLLGALIQGVLYAKLADRRATHLVVLIASLGTLAVIQNILAAVYTANILRFDLPWGSNVFTVAGNVRLTVTQLATVVLSLAAYAGVMWFAHRHHPGQADSRRGIQPVPGRDHPAAAASRPYLRDGDRLSIGVPAGRSGAVGFRLAAL